jgi:trimeric autotransporter adhesin
MSTINVDIVNPETGNDVIVNGIRLRTLLGGPGTFNQYIGSIAPVSLTANANLMVGLGTGGGITTGSYNTFLGFGSGAQLTVGENNVAIGVGALGGSICNLSSDNIAIGRSALGAVDDSSYGQVAIGHLALAGLITVTASPNTAIGWKALSSTAASGGNTALGYQSGLSVTTGLNNTFLGTSAGASITTGTNNICIGYLAGSSTPTASNEITLGNSSNTVLRCAVTSITSLSDARDKEDIKDLSTGLDFVKTLRPVEFTWKDRDENGKQGIADFGFIAQDLKKSQEDAEKSEVLKLVYDENPEKLEASYGKLIPILVKAIQELSEEVKQLKK